MLFIVLGLLSSVLLSSKRSTTTGQVIIAKRPRITTGTARSLVQQVQNGQMDRFLSNPLSSLLNLPKYKMLCERCLDAAITFNQLEMLSHLLDVTDCLNANVALSIVRWGSSDALILLSNKRPDELLEYLDNDQAIFYGSLVMNNPIGLLQIPDFFDYKGVRALLKFSWTHDNLRMFIMLLDRIPYKDAWRLKFKYLRSSVCIGKTEFIVWLVNTMKLSFDDIENLNLIEVFEYTGLIREKRFSELRNRLMTIGTNLAVDMRSIIIYTAGWYGSYDPIELLSKHNTTQFIEFKLSKLSRLSLFNGTWSNFFKSTREIHQHIISFDFYLTLIKDAIRVGRYSDLNRLFKVMLSSWKRKFTKKNSLDKKVRVISRLVRFSMHWKIEKFMNYLLAFIDANPRELTVRNHFIDYLFDTSADLFSKLAQLALDNDSNRA